MRRYKNLGTPIEIQIQDEYSVVGFINLVNKEKSEYKCDLHIRDNESGFMMEIDKSPTIISDYKTVKRNVAEKLSTLIDNGYFNDDINGMQSIYNCLLLNASGSKED